MPLTELHEGIDVPEYASHLPWLITRGELEQYVPLRLFTTSAGWPQLRFTLLGVTATFSFNFVTHPGSRLLGVGFSNPDDGTIEAAFRATSGVLRECLGKPNEIDHQEHYNEVWLDDRVRVHHSANILDEAGAARTHRLSVYYHAGAPRVWIGDGEPTLAQVKRLFDLMPGVKVTELWRPPGRTVFGLTVGSLPALARLAHITRAANVRFQVEVDEYQQANRRLAKDDSTGIIYRITVDGPCEPDPGGFLTTLQSLGINLAENLRDQGLLSQAEAHRLDMAFNNHEG